MLGGKTAAPSGDCFLNVDSHVLFNNINENMKNKFERLGKLDRFEKRFGKNSKIDMIRNRKHWTEFTFSLVFFRIRYS